MTEPAKPGVASDAELRSAEWIFEQLAFRDGQHVDRSKMRRIVDEAANTYSGIPDGGWWRWIIETGYSLGRNGRVLEGELSDLIQLARNGMTVILRSADGQNWHAVMPGSGRNLLLGTPDSPQPVLKVTRSGALNLLRQRGFSGIVRCVTFDSTLSTGTGGTGHDVDISPLDRLMTLLRAESGDIWVVIVFALVSGLLSMTSPLAVEALVNTVAFGRFLQPVIVLSLMLMVFLLFQAALEAVKKFVVEIIQRRLFARVAADVSFRLPRVRVESVEEDYTPERVNRFFDIVTTQKICAELLLDGIAVVLSVCVGMAVLAFYHPYLLAFDVVLILLMLVVMFVLGRGAVKTSIKESKTKYAMAAWLEDLAKCPTAFRYDGALEYAIGQSDHFVFNYLSARKKHFRVLMRQVVSLLLVQALASTTLLGIGGWLVISGQLSLGQLVAAELIVAIVVSSCAKLGKHMESFYDLMASVDKLGVLLDLPLERTSGLLTLSDRSSVAGPCIQLHNVSYHDAHETPVLRGFCLSVHEGEHLALTGESGSGKSIVLDLMFGLREPASGSVRMYGADVRDVRPDVLRRQVALAREAEIFAGSVAENVHLGRPDIGINDVRAAAEIVGLTPAIQRLPHGFETKLSSIGTPLTSSQLRRLALARAIVGRPRILLVDELLDSMADEEAVEVLERLMASDQIRTIILVTNRVVLKAKLKTVIMSHASPVTESQP